MFSLEVVLQQEKWHHSVGGATLDVEAERSEAAGFIA